MNRLTPRITLSTIILLASLFLGVRILLAGLGNSTTNQYPESYSIWFIIIGILLIIASFFLFYKRKKS